jgi:hypothetical protein
MLAAGLGYVATFLGHAMTAARLFRPQLPLFTAVGAAALVACAALGPARGVMGAAQATVATAAVTLLGAAAVNVYALRHLPTKEVSRWS